MRFFQFPLWAVFLLVTSVAFCFALIQTPPYETTNSQFDVAIAGPGFFEVQDRDGTLLYTRYGKMFVNADGLLAIGRLDDELVLLPPITIPTGFTGVTIQRTGSVLVSEPGSATTIGSIELATFQVTAGLDEVFPNFYSETEDSGPPQYCQPRVGTPGVLLQGMLTNANAQHMHVQKCVLIFFAVAATLAGGLTVLEFMRLRAALTQLIQCTSRLRRRTH